MSLEYLTHKNKLKDDKGEIHVFFIERDFLWRIVFAQHLANFVPNFKSA